MSTTWRPVSLEFALHVQSVGLIEQPQCEHELWTAVDDSLLERCEGCGWLRAAIRPTIRYDDQEQTA